MTDNTIFETRGEIAHFIFNRPQARNALTFDMYENLREACDHAGADPQVKALLIYGAGDKAFAAGTDIAEFRALQSAQDAVDYEIKIERVLTALEKCRVPTIAAIAGACTGGGAAIAACCDLRLGGVHRQIRLSHRPHAWQLPVGRQLRPPRQPDRPGARQGPDFYRPADRRR